MKFGMGQSVTRKEDQRFLTGGGRYCDDVSLPGQAYGAVLRSPVAAGTVVRLDIEAARAAPGVLAVYRQDDLTAAGIKPLPCLIPLNSLDGSPRAETPRHALSKDRVRYVGDPLAFVVAESAAAARDALELIELDIEEVPAVTDLALATRPGQPRVWEETAENVSFVSCNGDKAATDARFAEARHVVPFEIVNNRVVVNPMEPRAVVADFDAAADVMVLHVGCQGVHNLRNALAAGVFGVKPEQLRILSPDVGGGFGMKIFTYHEQVLCLFAARDLGRPVKWTADRTEGFLSDIHGRDNVTSGEIALDADLRFLGLRLRTLANMGAYQSGFGPFIPMIGTRVLGGVYAFPAIYTEVTGVLTNTVPVDAYRGAGRPEAIYVTERAIDHAAAALGISGIELRRRNYVRPEALPYTTALAQVLDSGAFEDTLDKALQAADVEGFAARRARSEAQGRLRGLGAVSYMEVTAGSPEEHAEIRFPERGGVDVLVGTQSNGQGHETAFAQIVAERLGVDFHDISVVMGDSESIRSGGGTGGSRSLIAQGGAITDAAEKIIEKGRQVAAQVLEAAAADIEFRAAEGAFEIVGTDRRIAILDLAGAAREPGNLPDGLEPGLDGSGDWAGTISTYPNGAHVVEVEIDRETCVPSVVRYVIVDDFGNMVNPLLVAGQVHGGVAQGLGQALWEHCVYDDESGQLLSGSFMDYAMPRADNLPAIDLSFNPQPCRTNGLGTKGCGEAGAVGAPGAVIQAICDALGITHIDMPATPQRIFEHLHGAGLQRQAAE